MKKSVIAVLLAALAIPSSAMALQPATRGVLVAGAPAGATTSTFVGPDGLGFGLGGCVHRLTWISPAGPVGGSTTCDLIELNIFGAVCSPSVNVNIPVVSDDDECAGYVPGGVGPVPADLTLQETNGNPTLVGYGLFDGFMFPFAVLMQ